MADTKISALTAITGANLATDDEFPVVDTSTTTTKKITKAELTTAILGTVTQTVWIPAAAMASRTTTGGTAATRETTTNKVMLRSINFADSGAESYAQFTIGMPKGWDEGTVTFVPYWTYQSGSGDVIWGIRAVAISNDDALDAAVGGAQTSTDTAIAANDLHIGPTSSAITISGTPAENDLVVFEVYRDGDNASDTFSGSAELLGIKIIFTAATLNDA